MGKRAGQAFADFCHNTAGTAFSNFQRRHEIRSLVQWCVGCATLVIQSFFFYYGNEPLFAMDTWAAGALGMLEREKGRACAVLKNSPLQRKTMKVSKSLVYVANVDLRAYNRQNENTKNKTLYVPVYAASNAFFPSQKQIQTQVFHRQCL